MPVNPAKPDRPCQGGWAMSQPSRKIGVRTIAQLAAVQPRKQTSFTRGDQPVSAGRRSAPA